MDSLYPKITNGRRQKETVPVLNEAKEGSSVACWIQVLQKRQEGTVQVLNEAKEAMREPQLSPGSPHVLPAASLSSLSSSSCFCFILLLSCYCYCHQGCHTCHFIVVVVVVVIYIWPDTNLTSLPDRVQSAVPPPTSLIIASACFLLVFALTCVWANQIKPRLSSSRLPTIACFLLVFNLVIYILIILPCCTAGEWPSNTHPLQLGVLPTPNQT